MGKSIGGRLRILQQRGTSLELGEQTSSARGVAGLRRNHSKCLSERAEYFLDQCPRSNDELFEFSEPIEPVEPILACSLCHAPGSAVEGCSCAFYWDGDCQVGFCDNCIRDQVHVAMDEYNGSGVWCGVACPGACGGRISAVGVRSQLSPADFDLLEALECERRFNDECEAEPEIVEEVAPETCGVCFDSAEDCDITHRPCCGSTFCKDCLSSYVEAKLSNQILQLAYDGIKCPAVGCHGRVEPDDARKILPKSVFDNLLARLTTLHSTSKSTVVPLDLSVGTSLGKRDSWSESDKLYLQWADQAVCAAKSRTCPRCGVRIEKNGGCNHMKCGFCGLDFDWTSPVTAQGSHALLKVVTKPRYELVELESRQHVEFWPCGDRLRRKRLATAPTKTLVVRKSGEDQEEHRTLRVRESQSAREQRLALSQYKAR